MSAAPRRPSARTLIVSLYGAFIRDLGGWIAVADLIELLGNLDIEAQVARTAVTRLKGSGQLIAETRDGRPGYRASAELLDVLSEGDERLFGTKHGADLSDGWLVIVFTVPESQRDQRHVLRTRLAALGAGSLSPGVFIAPRRAESDIRRMLSAQRLNRYVSLFGGDYLGPAELDQLAKGVWGSAKELSADYRAFTRAHSSRAPRRAAEAFVRYVHLLEDWRALTYADPGLPDSLSPAATARARATELFGAARAALAEPAAEFVRQTLTS